MGWRNPRQSRDVPTPILVAKPSAAFGSPRGSHGGEIIVWPFNRAVRSLECRSFFYCEPVANHLQGHRELRWGSDEG